MPLASEVQSSMEKSPSDWKHRLRSFFRNLTVKRALNNSYVVSVFVFLVTFAILAVLRPPFVETKDPNSQTAKRSWTSICLYALLAGGITFAAGFFSK